MVPYGHRFLTKKKDPRQYSHQRTFGAVSLPQLPDTLGRKPIAILDQLATNFCTAFAYAAAAAFKLGFKVSPEFQTAMEGKIAGKPIMDGAKLDTMCNAGSVYGVVRDDACPIKLDAGNAATVADWSKYPELSGFLQGFYYSAHTGKYDAFDNLRSAIYNARQAGQTAVAIIATYWYREFNDAGAREGVIDTIPTSASISDHAYVFFDWDGDHALCQLSNGLNSGNGGVFRIHRDIINFLFANPLADSRLTDDRDLNEGSAKARIIQKLLILYYQAIKIVQALLAASRSSKTTPPSPVASQPSQDTTPTVPESEPSQFPPMILKWAKAISRGEGASAASHNPGNLKFSTLTASWGATQGRAATDGGYLCNFANETAGMNALCNFLVLGAKDELAAFHQARTLGAFTKVYAGNPPQGYIDGITSDLGVPVDTNIASFLT